MKWIIKAIYPLGGHVVTFNDGPLRFDNKQKALDHAEMLNASLKKVPDNNTIYIVVEDQ